MAKKILIIEDEKPLANMLATKLHDEGYETDVAFDGEQGLKRALEWDPNLVLLDLVMPKMDGMTMLRRLRDDDKGKNLHVILLTNLSDTSKVYEAVTLGVKDYLVKTNWDLDEIIEEIKSKIEE
ncbi:MAG TPA: response regulator [Candidatus Saccharimonadales bacterium]|nr:response regulator [Candidatus Saccharimonadales bacterium]